MGLDRYCAIGNWHLPILSGILAIRNQYLQDERGRIITRSTFPTCVMSAPFNYGVDGKSGRVEYLSWENLTIFALGYITT